MAFSDPGARVDTPSRSYTHLFGVDFGYPNPFCDWTENVKYFDWVADSFGIRDEIEFDTEVESLSWDEESGLWEIRMRGPQGKRVHHSRAVITAVGFLNRPNIPEIEGASEFEGPSWHTSRWPQDMDLAGSMYKIMTEHFKVALARCKQTISAVNLNQKAALILELPKNSAGIFIESLTFDENSIPIELLYSYHRGDKYKLEIELGRYHSSSETLNIKSE